MSRSRLLLPLPLVALLCFSVAGGASAQATLEPTWVATPPVGVVNQPVALLFANTTADSVYINSTVWEVRDSGGILVAEFVFRFAAFWPIPPGGVIPGGFLPEYADTFTATVWWHTPAGGSGAYDTHSKSIEIPVFDGSVVWNVAPDPIFERTDLEYSQVTLSLTNGSPNTVWLNSTNPWEITDSSGGHVYSPATSPAYTPVLPGQTKSWPWALVYEDSSSGPQYVPPDEYVASIDIYNSSGDATGVELQDRFTVMPRPTGSVIWRVTPTTQSTKSVVLLTLTNATADTICCNSLIPWTIKDDVGNEVYSPLRLWAILDLAPGESRSWVWDERDNSGTWVAGGTYHAEVTWWWRDLGPGSGATEDSAFRLIEMFRPAPCWYLIADRNEHASGDPVWFTFTNCHPDTVIVPWDHGWWAANAVGFPVYSPIAAQYIEPMPPGAQFRDHWDQIDYNEEQVPNGVYYICTAFWDKHYAGFYTVCSLPIFIVDTITGVGEASPGSAPFMRAGPNPFSNRARIEFSVPSPNTTVSMAVISLTGRAIFREDLGELPAGQHGITWLGLDALGVPVASGVYFIQLRIGEHVLTQRVALLR